MQRHDRALASLWPSKSHHSHSRRMQRSHTNSMAGRFALRRSELCSPPLQLPLCARDGAEFVRVPEATHRQVAIHIHRRAEAVAANPRPTLNNTAASIIFIDFILSSCGNGLGANRDRCVESERFNTAIAAALLGTRICPCPSLSSIRNFFAPIKRAPRGALRLPQDCQFGKRSLFKLQRSRWRYRSGFSRRAG